MNEKILTISIIYFLFATLDVNSTPSAENPPTINSTSDQCVHQNLFNVTSDHSSIVATISTLLKINKASTPFSNLPQLPAIRNILFNFEIEEPNYTVYFTYLTENIAELDPIGLDEYTCHFKNNLNFVFKPKKTSLSYLVDISISQRSAGRYNITFENVTFSFTANNTLIRSFTDVLTEFTYQRMNIKFEITPKDEPIISPYLVHLEEKIKSIIKSKFHQALNIVLSNSRNVIHEVVRQCLNPQVYDRISTLSNFDKISPFYKTDFDKDNSDAGTQLKLNALLLEGLTDYKTITYYTLGNTFVLNYNQFDGYIDFQSNSTSSNVTDIVKLKINDFKIEGKLQSRDLSISTIQYEAQIVCLKFNTTLTTAVQETLLQKFQKSVQNLITRAFRSEYLTASFLV